MLINHGILIIHKTFYLAEAVVIIRIAQRNGNPINIQIHFKHAKVYFIGIGENVSIMFGEA